MYLFFNSETTFIFQKLEFFKKLNLFKSGETV